MDIKAIQLFVNLAEELHFARAAQRSHLSASAATRAIQRLEDEVGAQLLERDNRTVRLTRSGREFLDYARNALQSWQQVQHRLSEQQQVPQGELRLYCSVTAAYSVLVDILPLLRQRYPAIEIHVNTGDQALAIQRIADSEEDLAVAAFPGSLPPSLAFQPMSDSPLVCIAPTVDCQVREQLTSMQEIDWSALPMIIAETGLARTRLENWFADNRMQPNVYAYVSGHEAIVSLVALGFGIGVVPQLVLENSPLRDKIDVLPNGPQLEPFNIGLVARRQRLGDPVVKAVWELAAVLP